MIDATEAVSGIQEADIANMLIVDDFQDTTLAGFALLEALHERGVRLLLVGNPDEAVQTFRGSYPEYLFNQAQTRMGARLERIEGLQTAHEGDTAQTVSNQQGVHGDYRTLVATRVSLSIASTESTDVPLPDRPGKMSDMPGAMPSKRCRPTIRRSCHAGRRQCGNGLVPFLFRRARRRGVEDQN